MTEDRLTYRQAIDYLMGRINYERLAANQYSARDLKLDRMGSLLQALGNPQDSLPAVHIAGTKGKGSTAMMTAAMLTAAGYRVGLYTSPHITRLEERMTVNGRPPSEAEMVSLTAQLRTAVEVVDAQGELGPLTYFEILTAMAWLLFRRENVDIVVLEVGLGGRLDSTNLCRPEVTVITSISLDHTQILGATLDKIAREKAGILKPGIPLICGVTAPLPREAIEQIANTRNVPILQLGQELSFQYEPKSESESPPQGVGGTLVVTARGQDYSDIHLPMLGAHQAHNAALATAAVLQMRERGWNIPTSAIYTGLQSVTCPVRMEVIQTDPLTILDAAHNMASIRAFGESIQSTFPNQRKLLIFATTKDKPVEEMLRYLLPRFDQVVVTQYLNNPRRLGVRELSAVAREVTDREFVVAESPQEAWNIAARQASNMDLICVAGSFFIAAELREILLAQRPGMGDSTEQASTVTGPPC
ncbi:Folylpolyglutamate synthase [Symmachiella macrocystis]|uniref:Dihydrofolate synthase/folylpolyglutamate synthase n=1 Tax=Symmachiella macrocystis TaxID=2527985 RepID=A0A5C6BAJ8_9PLAN|nr:folylpolyglutamate synthase/dihydrofolate synthase family protein [Symmachiella macrocystis]TWU08682.1 Folylpolyglutamate synthase [Symmachiella macrocystis]